MPFDNVILHSCECDKELHVDAKRASNPLVCHQTPPSQLKLAQTCQAQATVSILQHSNETRFNKETHTHTDMATRIRSCIK